MRRPGRLIFSALLFFSLFLSFSRHFSSNMASRRLALPRLRRRLKGKKGVNRHASPYRLKNYAQVVQAQLNDISPNRKSSMRVPW
jgi:hypothetical protein